VSEPPGAWAQMVVGAVCGVVVLAVLLAIAMLVDGTSPL
jgi:hypothetical protein